MHIAGKSYTRAELLSRCADLSALYGARRVTLTEGKAAGLRAVEVRTAGGLRCLLAEDRCLDILELDYRGVGLGFLCKNGLVSGLHATAEDFWRSWSGGMLATCGLRNAGPGCTVDGESFPQHGHIGVMPAKNVGVAVDDAAITITGVMRESAMFGHCLELFRTLTIPSGGASIRIRDEVRNLTSTPEPLLLLYHFNFGFPFLGEDLTMRFPAGEMRGREAYSQQYADAHMRFSPPIDNEPEQCFFHFADEKNARVELVNHVLGIKASLLYDSESLPVLTEWKSMQSGDYALGIEPGTSLLRGRAGELAEGYSVCVDGYGSRIFEVELSLESV